MDAIGGPIETMQYTALLWRFVDAWRHWALVPAGHMKVQAVDDWRRWACLAGFIVATTSRIPPCQELHNGCDGGAVRNLGIRPCA